MQGGIIINENKTNNKMPTKLLLCAHGHTLDKPFIKKNQLYTNELMESFNQEARKPIDFLYDSYMVIRWIEYETVWSS